MCWSVTSKEPVWRKGSARLSSLATSYIDHETKRHNVRQVPHPQHRVISIKENLQQRPALGLSLQLVLTPLEPTLPVLNLRRKARWAAQVECEVVAITAYFYQRTIVESRCKHCCQWWSSERGHHHENPIVPNSSELCLAFTCGPTSEIRKSLENERTNRKESRIE